MATWLLGHLEASCSWHRFISQSCIYISNKYYALRKFLPRQVDNECTGPVQNFQAEEVIFHKSYNSPERFWNDIALIRLDRPYNKTLNCEWGALGETANGAAVECSGIRFNSKTCHGYKVQGRIAMVKWVFKRDRFTYAI